MMLEMSGPEGTQGDVQQRRRGGKRGNNRGQIIDGKVVSSKPRETPPVHVRSEQPAKRPPDVHPVHGYDMSARDNQLGRVDRLAVQAVEATRGKSATRESPKAQVETGSEKSSPDGARERSRSERIRQAVDTLMQRSINIANRLREATVSTARGTSAAIMATDAFVIVVKNFREAYPLGIETDRAKSIVGAHQVQVDALSAEIKRLQSQKEKYIKMKREWSERYQTLKKEYELLLNEPGYIRRLVDKLRQRTGKEAV